MALLERTANADDRVQCVIRARGVLDLFVTRLIALGWSVVVAAAWVPIGVYIQFFAPEPNEESAGLVRSLLALCIAQATVLAAVGVCVFLYIHRRTAGLLPLRGASLTLDKEGLDISGPRVRRIIPWHTCVEYQVSGAGDIRLTYKDNGKKNRLLLSKKMLGEGCLKEARELCSRYLGTKVWTGKAFLPDASQQQTVD